MKCSMVRVNEDYYRYAYSIATYKYNINVTAFGTNAHLKKGDIFYNTKIKNTYIGNQNMTILKSSGKQH